MKEYIPTTAESRLLLWLERTVTPAWGVNGGKAGRTARCVIGPGTPEEVVVKKANHRPVPADTVIRCYTAGGGGYGPPWARDPAHVLADVRDGYISREAAEGEYGLRFVDASSLTLDEAATREARGEMQN